MKKKIIRIVVVIGLVLLAWGGFHVVRFGWAVWGIAKSERAAWQRFQSLVATNDHTQVAHQAIELIQATTNDALIQDTDIAGLPSAIANMRPSYVSIHPRGMGIEFHGGFDHYGFMIEETEGGWDMLWYTEKEHHRLLRITEDEIGKANNTSEGIRRPADGSPKPSM